MNIASLLCSDEVPQDRPAPRQERSPNVAPAIDIAKPASSSRVKTDSAAASGHKRRAEPSSAAASQSAKKSKEEISSKEETTDAVKEGKIEEAVEKFVDDKELLTSIHSNLQQDDSSPDATYGIDASVYISAVLGYVSSKILAKAGNQSRQRNEERISPEDIERAIETDADLNRVVKDVLISNGLGVDSAAYTAAMDDYLTRLRSAGDGPTPSAPRRDPDG